MAPDKLANLLVVVLLVEMMIGVGLGVSLRDVASVFGDLPLLLRTAFANYLLVPAGAIALLFFFRPPPLVAAGFLLVAVCPGAPFGPPLTSIAKADVTVSVGLMVALAASSAIVAPLLLALLLPFVAQGAALQIDAVKVVRTLSVTQLFPLAIGLLVRWKRSALADKLLKPANLLTGILSLTVFGLILVLQFRTLAQIRLAAFVGITVLVLLCLLGGLLLGGSQRGVRWAVALTTAARNVGVALVIATASFPRTAAVSSVVVFAIFQTVLLTLVAFALGRASNSLPMKSQTS